jgi:hypothetical protein
MDDKDSVKLTLSGRITFTESISLAQAAQVIAYLDGATTGTAVGGSSTRAPRLPGPQTRLSPREALDASQAKTNPEKIVALALLVAQDTFTTDDVRPLFKQAREAAPKNFGRDLDTAIKAGWVVDADTKGEYYVADKAMGVLETGFDGLRSARTGSPKTRGGSRKNKRTSSGTPEVFANADSVSPTSAGLIGYHKLKTKTDKLLWAVHKAKELGVSAVTNQELVWLTDRLGEGIATTDITAYYRQNHKSGYINRSTQDNKIRITPDGEEYLKSKTAS